MTDDLEKMREDLYGETKHSHDTKDSSGRFKGIFIDELPEGAGMWKATEGEHILDLLPFKAGQLLVDSVLQPKVKKVGQWTYKLDVYVHPKVGPGQSDEICLAMVFEKPCPPCELRNLLFEKEKLTEAEQRVLDMNRPIRRCGYNIHCKDSQKEMDKGAQIWLIAHWFFENHIAELSQLPHGGGFILFSHPKEGKSIMFKRKGTGRDNTSYLGHRFLDRDPLDEEILAKTHPLDSLVRVLSYEEFFQKFFQIEYTGQPVTLELMAGVSVEEEKKEEEGTLPTDPPPTEEPTTEETPAPSPSPEATVDPDNKCPHGHIFGADLEKFPGDCGRCAVWDDCADESDRLKKEGGKEEKPKLNI
jgi:hypothetical protein